MAYRAVILGCGHRGATHARSYEGIDGVELVALCDKDADRLEKLRSDLGIERGYADYAEMLEKEQPDVVDAITQPPYRVESFRLAAEAGAKLVIVEKPMALLPSELAEIERIARETGAKLIVNHQRRYMHYMLGLKEIIGKKIIGDVQFIRGSVRGGLLQMGTHLMDMILMTLGEAEPTRVWAAAEGAEMFNDSHSAPTNVMAIYDFPGPIRVCFECGPQMLGTIGETGFWMHQGLDIWGSRGRAWATQMQGWGYQAEGMIEAHIEPTCWPEDDKVSQRRFVEAAVEWLDDPSAPHLNRLELAARGFRAMMAAVKSALLGRAIDLPTETTDDDVHALRRKLAEATQG